MGSKVIASRYELVRKIGDGGMAVVYKANDRLLSRNVAVKILKPEFTQDEKFIENFRRESHAAARLSNPNIVNVFDVGREGNINYIVMELVEGKTLAQVIKEEAPMDYRRVINFSKQIANGLSAAHKNGIIHRDVKPHNILINEDGIAKITDFGIAKAVTNATIADNTNESIMGSVHYFSPEQARGGYVDEKSDIYSLGIVMYEMLTGKVPFDGDSPVQIALMHINKQITPPSKLVPGIPPNLERIVMKATQKYQTNRFSDCNEMISALNEVELVTRVVGNDRYRKKPVEDENRRQQMQRRMEREAAEDKKRAASRKKLIIALIAAAAVCLVILGICYATGIIGNKTEVPDLRGLSYSQAKERADDAGFKIKKGEEVYSNKYDDGDITSQNPEEGSKAVRGSTITVNICRKDEGTVPKLTGKTEKEARKLIKEKGFTVGTVSEVTDAAPKGEVVKQDPEAGSEVDPGSAISFSVSNGLGKKKVKVPDILGKTRSQAESALKAEGLSLGNVTEEESDEYDEGDVMEQNPSSGTKVDEGSSVDIVVSKGGGKEGQSINLDIDYDQADSDVFYMTVTVSDEEGTRNILSNVQCKKSDGHRVVELTGKGKGTVKVLFDGKNVMTRTVNFRTGEMD